MNAEIINQVTEQVNLQTDVPILTIKAFDKNGKWTVEVKFEDGIKATKSATADEVNAIESRLCDLGWQVDASLFHRGFNAKPVVVEEFTFAMPDLWPDNLGLQEPTL